MNRRFLLAAALAPALLMPVRAEDPGITRQQADQILQELRQIRQILEKQQKLAQAAAQPQQPQEQRATLKLDDSYMLGSKNAPVTMVEFTDLQCPFCQRFHVTTFKEIKEKYIDTGKVRFYSRDLPLDFHANAARAAEAARCAGEQGQFWQMRDVLGSNAAKLGPSDITGYAQQLKLDVPKFQACVDSGKFRASVQQDLAMAQSVGVNGTPAFVIGKSTPDGVDGELVVGALPFQAFDEKIKAVGK